MFDIGFWELFFLFLLALFVLGPERLPVVASYLGKQFGKVQRYFSNVRNQIDDEVDSTDINKILKAYRKKAKSKILKSGLVSENGMTLKQAVINDRKNQVFNKRGKQLLRLE